MSQFLVGHFRHSTLGYANGRWHASSLLPTLVATLIHDSHLYVGIHDSRFSLQPTYRGDSVTATFTYSRRHSRILSHSHHIHSVTSRLVSSRPVPCHTTISPGTWPSFPLVASVVAGSLDLARYGFLRCPFTPQRCRSTRYHTLRRYSSEAAVATVAALQRRPSASAALTITAYIHHTHWAAKAGLSFPSVCPRCSKSRWSFEVGTRMTSMSKTSKMNSPRLIVADAVVSSTKRASRRVSFSSPPSFGTSSASDVQSARTASAPSATTFSYYPTDIPSAASATTRATSATSPSWRKPS